MFETWKKEECVIVPKPKEIQLALQWMQRHHKWHNVYKCTHCYVDIIIDGYSRDQWNEWRHNEEGMWLKDRVVQVEFQIVKEIVDNRKKIDNINWQKIDGISWQTIGTIGQILNLKLELGLEHKDANKHPKFHEKEC
jgi:hypothetical protein